MRAHAWRLLLAVPFVLALAACTPSAESVKKVLMEHPEILFDVMEKNGTKFSEVLQKTMVEARRIAQEKANADKQKEIDDQIKNPKKVPVENDRPVRGNRNAPMLLVIYSDFQCPYCQRGFTTVEELRKKYGDKMATVYKHMPLDFHPLAMPAAKRFEAIARQSPEKAWRYHDMLFTDQRRMSEGEKFLDEAAKKVGANMEKMKKDMDSAPVTERIQADIREAQGLGIRGTPGFLINGVVVHGALPSKAFEDIIAKRPTYN